MTQPQALEHLKLLVQPNLDPKLQVSELQDCLNQSRKMDSAGKAPVDTGWIPTWDLNYAAMLAWQMKMAKAASYFGFKDNEQQFNPQQVFAQCEKMATLYRNKISGTVEIPVPTYT